MPSELPPWMKFLHGKLMNPATPLNIRLFISKLIINTEEVKNFPSSIPLFLYQFMLLLSLKINTCNDMFVTCMTVFVCFLLFHGLGVCCFVPGFPALCQTLARATAAACRLWEQRRAGHPLHGGGHCGHSSLLDKSGQSKGC